MKTLLAGLDLQPVAVDARRLDLADDASWNSATPSAMFGLDAMRAARSG